MIVKSFNGTKELGLQEFKEKTKLFLDEIQALLVDKVSLSLSASWNILQQAVAKLVIIIEENLGDLFAGTEKKAEAMKIAEQMIDMILVITVVPFVPVLIKPLFSRYIKNVLMQIASGSIDAIVSTFRATNVFPSKGE
jgi:hypothetical protein